jgi:hypothetical protein
MLKVLAVLSLLPMAAFAGKKEREFMNKEVTPAIAAAEAAYSKSCGCKLKVSIASTIASEDDMREAKRMANEVTEGAPKYCTDADSKKAICKMNALELAKGSSTGFSLAGSKGKAMTDGQSYVSWDMMTAEIDK